MTYLHSVLNAIYKLLPGSPFRSFIDSIEFDAAGNSMLNFLNWFLPFKSMLIVFSSFLAAVACYYIYQAILRIIKVLS